MANNLKLIGALVLCMVLAGSLTSTEAGMACNQIKVQLAQCMNYLIKGGNPPPQCCAGVKNVVSASRTTPDRQSACNCLKATAATLRGINVGNAASLPGKCGVNIPYKISPNTNCATVK
ncbi:non-specific lipid-transfer protein 1-like [Ziziphus jujuba]|uniref:Non-specific lipid-transfer protein n=1 Tax=Ziziphus jujuba TaxID=326968 RepID=A0A6P4BEC2_ZIZJJ|nr:non-specific lipid-transfer protein 1-like [Ziziphus jujuba]